MFWQLDQQSQVVNALIMLNCTFCVAADIVLPLSVVSFLYLNLKSVPCFAFLGSVAYKKKKKNRQSSDRGRKKEQKNLSQPEAQGVS